MEFVVLTSLSDAISHSSKVRHRRQAFLQIVESIARKLNALWTYFLIIMFISLLVVRVYHIDEMTVRDDATRILPERQNVLVFKHLFEFLHFRTLRHPFFSQDLFDCSIVRRFRLVQLSRSLFDELRLDVFCFGKILVRFFIFHNVLCRNHAP